MRFNPFLLFKPLCDGADDAMVHKDDAVLYCMVGSNSMRIIRAGSRSLKFYAGPA